MRRDRPASSPSILPFDADSSREYSFHLQLIYQRASLRMSGLKPESTGGTKIETDPCYIAAQQI
jgi:hypothetical protein